MYDSCRSGSYYRRVECQPCAKRNHFLSSILTFIKWSCRTPGRRREEWNSSHVAGPGPPATILGGDVHVPAEPDTNNGRTLFERFYSIKQDGSHIHILGCVVKVVLPRESRTTGRNGYLLAKKNSRAVLFYGINKTEATYTPLGIETQLSKAFPKFDPPQAMN